MAGRGGGIPTAPSGTGPTPNVGVPPAPGNTSGSGNSGGTGGQGSGGSGSGGGGGGGGDPYGYRRKAGKSYQKQAANLEAQAQALIYALKHSYGDALRVKLQNVNEILGTQDKVLMEGYRERVASLAGSVEDNEKAQGAQTGLNEQNRVRERGNALSEIALQGGGESDILQTQMASLRNWQANQSEIQRSLFDTQRSINSSLTDLNVDTKTGRVNLEAQALADKEMLWTTYYNQRGESLTQLGNIRGEQANLLDSAQEYGVGKGGNTKSSKRAFMQASKMAGKAWDNPGISKRLKQWEGQDEFEDPAGSRLADAPSVDLGQRPEGATLRTW